MFKFENPMYLWLLALLPAMLLLMSASAKRRKKALEQFASNSVWKDIVVGTSTRMRKVKNTLVLLAMLFLIIAAANPQYGFKTRQISRKGLDIMVVLDVSRSMLAQDVKPNRLERAKLEIKGLVDELKGDRIGLVVFAGSAYNECPLTLDYATFRMFLNDVATDSIPRGGTDIAGAIETATQALVGKSTGKRLIILVTDGEDHSGRLEQAVSQARADEIAIYTVAVGTSEGAPIKITDEKGNEEFIKDEKGNIVLSKAGIEQLSDIAAQTGGRLASLTGGGNPLDQIYKTEILKMERAQLDSLQQKLYESRFQWPLLIGFILLVAQSLIGQRKKRHA